MSVCARYSIPALHASTLGGHCFLQVHPFTTYAQLTKLAVFAAATVVTTELLDFLVMEALALQTPPCSRDCRAALGRNQITAIRAVTLTHSVFELTLRPTNPVFDRCVNLVLYRAFSRPARRHVVLLSQSIECA
jgi:hypothetical protein